MHKKLLESDEYQYGIYKVQPVEWADGDWRGSGLWLRALVTNHRLLLLPEKNAQSAHNQSIRAAEIARVWNVCLQGRDGIMVQYRNGGRIYLLVDWSQGGKLVKDLNTMLQPGAKPRILPRLLPN